MKIAARLPILVVASSILAAVTVGVFSYRNAATELHDAAKSRLVALRDDRHATITRYFRSIREDLELIASSPETINAIDEFTQAFGRFDQSRRFEFEQQLRTVFHPVSTAGDRYQVQKLNDPALTSYMQVHNRHHSWFELALRLRGYYDMFLITPRGDIAYTVTKESDFGANLLRGPLRGSNLGRTVETVLDAANTQSDVFFDFAPYAPSGNAPAAFIGRRIMDRGRLIGVLALQMPIGRINKVMQISSGMGETGETYLVGTDGLMRSDSRFSESSTILKQRVATEAVDLALDGESGVAVINDYRGVPVLSAYRPFDFLGVNWVVLSEQDIKEIEAPTHAMRDEAANLALVVCIGVGILGALLAYSMTSPLLQLSAAFQRFGETREPGDIPHVDAKDEIGDLARAFDDVTNDIGTYINEREKAEASAAANQAQLRLALNNMPGGMLMFDKANKVVVLNDQYRELFDFPEGLMVVGGTAEASLRYQAERGDFGDGDTDELTEKVMASLASGETKQYERQIATGRIIQVSLAPTPDGGTVAMYSDITARKEAEQKLRESEAVAKAILNTSFQLQGLLKPNGDLIEANAAAMSMIDVSKEDVVGVPFWDCPWWTQDPDIQERLRDAVTHTARGEVVKFQAEHHLPDGRVRIVDIRMSPVKDENGDVVLIVPEGHDITELKEAEEEIREARDAAEEATKAKATFLATMSHEIRTPMGGVIGMVDLLQQSKMTDDQRQMIDTVRDSAHSLLTIINDILDFSKIEAGKLDLEEIPISVRDVVEGAGEALAVSARNKGIGFSVYVDPDIPDALMGDQVRLRQILFNFGSNAVKFTEQGKVMIRADKVPSRSKKEITVRFRVIDEGIGIPEEAQKKLFQAFSQVEASTTRRFGGTGLGLSICQRLTELMNGEVSVESVEGEGSTFSATITLPVAKEHIIKSDGHDLVGLNVLSAHIDDDVREIVPRYLEHCGAVVTTTADLDETKALALKAVKAEKPFNVICIGSGWELPEQIKLVEALAAEASLSSTRYVITCGSRVKADRKEIDNTVYLDGEPMRRASFIKAVAVAAGRASPDVDYDESDLMLEAGEAPSVEDAEAAGRLILVAEDNVTNQDVIGRQLTLLGYAFEMADDGKQALKRMKKRSYGILLTDCHMPNLDGFDLARNVRKQKQDEEAHFPIVAITASVMKEEIDNCYTAGMDDYLPKPLELNKLKDMLRKWMPGGEPPPKAKTAKKKLAKVPAEPPDEPVSGNGPIDPSALKSVFGDDDETFKEILNDFVGPATANAEEIAAAVESKSAKDVGAAAHKLKSSSRSVGAIELADLCADLEAAGKSEDWETIDASAPRLPGIVKDVVAYISKL